MQTTPGANIVIWICPLSLFSMALRSRLPMATCRIASGVSTSHGGIGARASSRRLSAHRWRWSSTISGSNWSSRTRSLPRAIRAGSLASTSSSEMSWPTPLAVRRMRSNWLRTLGGTSCCSSASSAAPPITATGVRSSWLVLSMKARSRSTNRSLRAR
ncbi:hypothetical protein NB706_002544 [Xanthomonas sacchari]|nr:hypothetical protein [Xanthomonas sacchari]